MSNERIQKMEKLSTTAFQAAIHFLKTQAQDIDCAMFEHFFEGKPLGEVVEILSSYQNEDGGFGTLDYDMACPVSCLKHTESACRYIFALAEIPAAHPMIQKLLAYLAENYNPLSGEWDNLTVPAVNDYPHAPWWTHKESAPFVPRNRAELIAHYNPNTNSALAGMLAKYHASFTQPVLDAATHTAIEKIHSGTAFDQYAMMSDVYFVNALADEGLKHGLLQTLMGDGRLISLLDEDWGTENAYKLCHWIDSPRHSYYPLYRDAVQKNFAFLLAAQGADGSWAPSWRWGDASVWEGVNRRLKGVLTFHFLWTLQKFERIATT